MRKLNKPLFFLVTSLFIIQSLKAQPTVTINKAAGQPDPVNSTLVKYTVVFSEVVTGFDASDISFAGSTVPGTLDASVSGSGTTYTVNVTGITGPGNVVATILAGAAVNNEDEASLASTSTDNSITVVSFIHDLVVTKNSVVPYADIPGVIPYIISVSRPLAGEPTPVFNINLTDTLPEGTVFINFRIISINGVSPIVTMPNPGNQNTLSILFPFFPIGSSMIFELVVGTTPLVSGSSITNTARVSGSLGDINPTNNIASHTTPLMAAPTISCPQDTTVNTTPDRCGALVFFPSTNTVTTTGVPAPTISYKIESENGSMTNNNLSAFPGHEFFETGVNTVTVTATNAKGTATCSFEVTVVDNSPPGLTCPAGMTVNTDQGQPSATVSFNVITSSDCDEERITLMSNVGISGIGPAGTTPFDDIIFPIGVNTVNITVTDENSNSSTCSFSVTVVDNEPPDISCPAAVTVSCASDIPLPDISLATATDNSGVVTVSHDGDVISNQTCTNQYTLTRTYKATDGSGNTAACTQLITVNDQTPAQITGLVPSKEVLAPPNHKMVDITLNYTVIDNCSDPDVSISIQSNEPVNGVGDGDTDPDWEVIDDNHIRLRAERSAQGTGRVYTIIVTVDDGCNPPASATTYVRVAHNIVSPHSGNTVRVGSTVSLEGEFWDVPGNTHTAKWLIDGNTAKGSVTEPSGNKNGKVTGSYKFNTPGVYKLQMNVTDQEGVTTYANTNGDLEAIVVIYDPKGGNTYGGGYFNSPAGAFTADPPLTGKVSYGFAMNYFKNSTFPKGETQFEFKIGEFEFNALNFDYLVIGSSMAQFKGTGKITGGQSGISFIMSVIDGELDGSGTDKVRIKIFNKNTNQVYYDNQPGASEADLPVTPVGGNSTVVINNNQVNTITSAPVEEQPDIALHPFRVMAYPNPGNSQFTLRVNSADFSNKVIMQVSDVLGRVIENKTITANENITFGQKYKPGVYYLKIIQGENQRQLKLIKLHD